MSRKQDLIENTKQQDMCRIKSIIQIFSGAASFLAAVGIDQQKGCCDSQEEGNPSKVAGFPEES